MVVKDREGPIVRMQLGRGHVDLCKKSALELRKGKEELKSLEKGGVHEKERFFRIRAIVSTHGNAFPTRHNL